MFVAYSSQFIFNYSSGIQLIKNTNLSQSGIAVGAEGFNKAPCLGPVFVSGAFQLQQYLVLKLQLHKLLLVMLVFTQSGFKAAVVLQRVVHAGMICPPLHFSLIAHRFIHAVVLSTETLNVLGFIFVYVEFGFLFLGRVFEVFWIKLIFESLLHYTRLDPGSLGRFVTINPSLLVALEIHRPFLFKRSHIQRRYGLGLNLLFNSPVRMLALLDLNLIKDNAILNC